jgi:hypothetical protein
MIAWDGAGRGLAVAQKLAAIATLVVAAGGCETGATVVPPHDAGSPASDAGSPAPIGLTGRWAMFSWEDPVAVDLRSVDGALAGDGCCAGFSYPEQAHSCCGDITGQVVDRRATFQFPIDVPEGHYVYATDVYASADGRRMAGSFRNSINGSAGGLRLVAWLPIASSEAWLSDTHPNADPAITAVQDILGSIMRGYGLVLSDDPPPGSDFVSTQTYRLFTSVRGFVSGDLGAFWAGEMSWRADEQTMVVGPVPETSPGLPVALWLRLDGAALVSVEAATASGIHYHFAATPLP